MTDPSEFLPPSSVAHRKRKRLDLSKGTLDFMRREADRTHVSAMRLLRGMKDRPAGLTTTMVSALLTGAIRTGDPVHVAFVLARWAALPTDRHIPLTPEMSAVLGDEFKRTGLGPVTALKRGIVPEGLSAPVITAWIDGKVQTVSEGRWTHLLDKLCALPDASTPSRAVSLRGTVKRPITPEEMAELRGHRERTGVGGAILLRGGSDRPPGLTANMISNWLSGTVTNVAPDHLAYVLARYRAWP